MPNKKSPLTFIILQGPPAENNEITLFFQEARESIVRDTLNKVNFIPEIKEKILISGSQKLLKDFKEINTKFLPYKKYFHLGNYLLELIQEYNLNKLIYFGGGAAPLISKEELSKLAWILIKEKNIVVANNFFSCDFLGFTPASALNLIKKLPECDNPLSFLLAEKGGLRYKRLPISAGTFFDIDTPIDLAILKLYPKNGYFTKKILESYPFPIDKLKKIQNIFKNNKSEILIFGRISSAIYSYLFGKLLCRLRVFSEECGMKSLGRKEKGKVFSYWGYFIEEFGIERFFKKISKITQAAFIDSRVIFAHLKLNPTQSDRFYSDLGQWKKIKQPFIKKFTYFADNASIPIILGGHSLVNGGLYILSELI